MSNPVPPDDAAITSAVTEATIFVKYVSGAYVTNTVKGRRASSTSSAESAARKLAEKLFGPIHGPVEETSEGTQFVRRYRATGVLQDTPRWAMPTPGEPLQAVAPGQAITGDSSGAKLPPITTQVGSRQGHRLRRA